jgi:hypothetical protein
MCWKVGAELAKMTGNIFAAVEKGGPCGTETCMESCTLLGSRAQWCMECCLSFLKTYKDTVVPASNTVMFTTWEADVFVLSQLQAVSLLPLPAGSARVRG